MGHACEILTFDIKATREAIQGECDDWGNCHRDYHEGGGGGLPAHIKFTDRVFDCYEDAADYLNNTFGNYRELAVKFKSYPNKPAENTKMKDIRRRIDEYRSRIAELEKPHYANAKSKTITCKKCGSALAISYCGKTWDNNCPICRAELRPQSALDKVKKYRKTIAELEKELKELNRKELKKLEKSAVLRWAVACEVHC